jgi:hypothetical protein
MRKTWFILLLLSLFFVFSNSMALASITAEATASYTAAPTITGVNVINASKAMNVEEHSSTATPTGNADVGPVIFNNWTTAFPSVIPLYITTATVGTASATSSFAPGTSTLTSYTQAGPTGADTPVAESFSTMSVDFTYANLDTITVSIPYTLIVDLTSDVHGQFAFGYAQADIEVDVTHDFPSPISKRTSRQFISLLLTGAGASNQTYNTLSLTVNDPYLTDGDTGTILFNLYSKASGASQVPIPAAVWLLGSGLVGLVGIRRRFRN